VPTYDYQCRNCGAITEVIHSMLDEGPTSCERCGGRLRRILYPAGIIFKGSGFYSTDSRAKPPGDSSAAPKAAEGGATASGGAGTSSGQPPPGGATSGPEGST
jgi:putative FmdB family regulatory protein